MAQESLVASVAEVAIEAADQAAAASAVAEVAIAAASVVVVAAEVNMIAQKCTKQFVATVEVVVKFLSVPMVLNQYYVAHVLALKKVEATAGHSVADANARSMLLCAPCSRLLARTAV